MDHVDPTCLAECCGSRDDSLSWNLSCAKCEAIQVDSMDSQGLQGQGTLRLKKAKIKLKDGFLRRMNVHMIRMHIDPTQQSEVNDLRYDVFVSRNQKERP